MDEDLIGQRREITGDAPLSGCERCGRPLTEGDARTFVQGPLERVDPESRMRLCPDCWEGVERGVLDVQTFEDDEI